MKHFIFAAAVLISSPALAENPIGNCDAFVKGVAANSANPPQNDSTFSHQSAFAMGVYFGQAGGYTGSFETKSYAPYAQRIHDECSKAPDRDFVEVALKAYNAPSHPKGDSEFHSISYTDLKLDFQKMIGKKVSVSGVLGSLGDTYFLSDKKFSTNNIIVEVAKLDRDTRKFLLTECGGVGCQVTVKGVARKGIIGDEITAMEVAPL